MSIQKQFEKIGARSLVRNPRSGGNGLRIDVGRDRGGEYFDILKGEDVSVNVVDANPGLRHLVLSYKDDDGSHQFLCGHDERHWFVAAIPENTRVSKVEQAMEALKPEEVIAKQSKSRKSRRNRRKNDTFIRQGEWFFVPEPNFSPGKTPVLHHEPMTRNARSKPHMVDELVRFGGEQVFVSSRFPTGISVSQHERFLKEDESYRRVSARSMVKDPTVYVRGKVRHPDHKTITLTGWHRVYMNTEARSRAMRNVAFLD